MSHKIILYNCIIHTQVRTHIDSNYSAVVMLLQHTINVNLYSQKNVLEKGRERER